MRTIVRILACAALLGVGPAPARAQRPATPCVTPTPRCEQWLALGGGRSMVYSTYPLKQRNPAITRALIMVHGASRNADHYFETATAAAFLAGALGNTIVIAPRFVAGRDSVHANEVVWPEGRVSWRAGGMSPTHPKVSSFDFLDEILRQLADQRTFPNLKRVVVAGHSAGGQTATRYQMASKVHDALGVAISYVVANPSSYAWPSAERPLPTGDADPVDAYKESLGEDGEKVHTNFTYGPFDASQVPAYDQWPMGLNDLAGYVAGMTAEQLRKNLVARPATYLLGHVDVLPLGGFDSSPAAMAQGPTRRARGEAFAKYVNEKLGAHHDVLVVSECGHNDRCIYTTNVVLPVIFPR